MTRYERGRGFEYRVIHRLESLDWFCLRSAGSHGAIDILAAKGRRVLGVQCKGGTSAFGREDWSNLWDRCIEHGWTPIVALRGMQFMQITGPYGEKRKDWIEVKIT